MVGPKESSNRLFPSFHQLYSFIGINKKCMAISTAIIFNIFLFYFINSPQTLDGLIPNKAVYNYQSGLSPVKAVKVKSMENEKEKEEANFNFRKNDRDGEKDNNNKKNNNDHDHDGLGLISELKEQNRSLKLEIEKYSQMLDKSYNSNIQEKRQDSPTYEKENREGRGEEFEIETRHNNNNNDNNDNSNENGNGNGNRNGNGKVDYSSKEIEQMLRSTNEDERVLAGKMLSWKFKQDCVTDNFLEDYPWISYGLLYNFLHNLPLNPYQYNTYNTSSDDQEKLENRWKWKEEIRKNNNDNNSKNINNITLEPEEKERSVESNYNISPNVYNRFSKIFQVYHGKSENKTKRTKRQEEVEKEEEQEEQKQEKAKEQEVEKEKGQGENEAGASLFFTSSNNDPPSLILDKLFNPTISPELQRIKDNKKALPPSLKGGGEANDIDNIKKKNHNSSNNNSYSFEDHLLRKRDIGLCVQIKNDASLLDEFIAFHWIQGVGKFMIYDDESHDDPLNVLTKYIDLGIVIYRYGTTSMYSEGSNERQTYNLNECFRFFRERSIEEGLQWIAFPDMDEFMLANDIIEVDDDNKSEKKQQQQEQPRQDKDDDDDVDEKEEKEEELSDINKRDRSDNTNANAYTNSNANANLNPHSFQFAAYSGLLDRYRRTTLSQMLNRKFLRTPCILINRTWFGSSYITHKPREGLVIEHYTMGSEVGRDGFGKCIANIAPLPDAVYNFNATGLYTVHNFIEQAKAPCTFPHDARELRLNHYVRSLEDYEMKVKTGHKVLQRYTKPFEVWWERDRNERVDFSALIWHCEVRTAMQQFQEITI